MPPSGQVRYPCPYSRDQHDPAKPPEDVDAFGYHRLSPATIAAMRAEVERLRRKHHPMCYQIRGVPDDLPADLCDCRVLWMLEGGQAVTQRAESAEAERDWLLSEASDELRARFRTLKDQEPR